MDTRDYRDAEELRHWSPLARVRFAVETLALAESLYGLIFPPWRWPEWRRVHREVKQRNADLVWSREHPCLTCWTFHPHEPTGSRLP